MRLDERAVLVSLKISLPTGTRRDKQATEDVEKMHNSRNLGRFNKDLINKKFMADIKSAETKARAHLYVKTVPWGDDDSRLLAVRRQIEFAEKMGEYDGEFQQEKQKIIAQWPAIVTEAQERLGTLFDPRQYPDVESLPSKFKFRLRYLPVPTAGDLRCQCDAEQLEEMKARLVEDSAAALQGTRNEAWGRLYEEVARMAERLGKPEGRVHATVVSSLMDLCDILPDLNFTDDPKLNKAIELVKQNLIVPVEALRNDPVKKENTAVAAAKIAKAMSGWMKGA